MDIVQIASELAPIAKVGGLGDVLHGLSVALARKGHRVRVFLPKYDCIDYHLVDDLHVLENNLLIKDGQDTISNTLWAGKCHGLELILVEGHHPKNYFERKKIYGETDDSARFLYFCKVTSTYLNSQSPDIIQLHDWPTAASVLFLETTAKTVFTIHNLAHQGHCMISQLQDLGAYFNEKELQDPIEGDHLNLMKAALDQCDILTTVSPSYMEEILTPGEGCGLEKTLKKNRKKLHGILNGIETEYWNPSSDPFLIKTYDFESHKLGKLENKQHIQKHFNLSLDPSKPLVAAITRLAPQKGPDLILYGIEKTLKLGGQFVLIGSNGDSEIERALSELENHPDVALHLEYNEPLSHLLYAASDLFLMPSIFEPCGLAQMIAMRYGSVPLVRATGGLKDTVFDEKNGFTFTPPDNKGVDSVLEKAFSVFGTETWENLIQEGMSADLSWEKSAEKYLELFH